MKRFELVNWFVREYGYTRYLEIGIDNPSNCHNRVRCEYKVGVDPNVGKTTPPHFWREPSDKFFSHNTDTFDIVFVDGLHIGEQVVRDVENALSVLSSNGTIVCHDCRPYNVRVAGPKRVPGQSWYGTVWQGWSHLRATREDLQMHVVTDDCGLGVIRRGHQLLYYGKYETWEHWVRNQNEIMLPITPSQALRHYARVN